MKHDAFDLIFMDIQMPIMDGLKATEIIRKGGNKTVIIALTANVMHEDKALYFDIGINDFLAKPIQINKLDTLLRKWLN